MSHVKSRRKARVPHDHESDSDEGNDAKSDTHSVLSSDNDYDDDDSSEDHDSDSSESDSGDETSSSDEQESDDDNNNAKDDTAATLEEEKPNGISSTHADTQQEPSTSNEATPRPKTDNLNEREKQIIERREYRRRLAEDPSFVPFVGEFWSHDDRYRSDALKPADDKDHPSSSSSSAAAPKFASSPSTAPPQQQRRRYPNRGVHRRVPEERLNQRWGHDGYEELMRMEELEEREGRKFSTLNEYYRSKRNGGHKQQQSRNRRTKADIPEGAGASGQWQQVDTVVESFDQQWPTLGTTDKEDTTNKEGESTTNEGKENDQWGTITTTTTEKEDDQWGTTTTTTKNDEGWGDIEQPKVTGWNTDTMDAQVERKQHNDTKPRNDKRQQSKSKQPMSRAINDTKKRSSAPKKAAANNGKEEEIEWKSLASWDTGKSKNDVSWQTSDSQDKIKSPKVNGDDSWNASVPWEEGNRAKTTQTSDSGWGDVNNQVADDNDWKQGADWEQSTAGWSTSTAPVNGWGDSNKTEGWGSSTSGSWRATKDKEKQPSSREQRRGRGYLSQKKPFESTTKSKPMSKHAKPFSPSQPIHTTPTVPTTTTSEPTSVPDNASPSLYAFATEPWQTSGSPRDDAHGHERFIEDQEDQESDVEIILEADTSASASRSEVDTATPPKQRDLEGNWRRRDQQERVGDEGGKDDMIAAQTAAMQQGVPYFYPPAMGGYMHMPPYPIPMPMTSAPGGATAPPPSAMMPIVTTAVPNATTIPSTSPQNGSNNTESPDNGSYVPSSYEANGMVYYSVNPSAMYPYYYYPPPMAMPMMAAAPPRGTEQGTDPSVEDGWGPEPDQHAQDSGWEADKNAQATFNPPFHYYPSYS
ncbi:hypothetical protein K492DRAFT_210110 [Lichtheimia hyalospora FSU 10163]|nr:hypothetical protein K492DRAFT_210110 [Lichtheimia hyalospora FSU 10163]